MGAAFHIKGAKVAFFQKNGHANGFLRIKPLSISKMSHEDWNQFGERQLEKGNYSKAIGHFDRALEVLPRAYAYLLNRATAVYGLMKAEGRPSEGAGEMLAEASRDCQFVSDSYIRDLPAKRNPALQAHYDRLQYAIDLYADIRDLHQSLFDVQTYLSRAEVSKAAGNLQNALADYSEALLFEPDNIDALVGRAKLRFFALNDKLEAASDFRKLAKIAPEGSEARRLAHRCMEEMALATPDYWE